MKIELIDFIFILFFFRLMISQKHLYYNRDAFDMNVHMLEVCALTKIIPIKSQWSKICIGSKYIISKCIYLEMKIFVSLFLFFSFSYFNVSTFTARVLVIVCFHELCSFSPKISFQHDQRQSTPV